MARVTVEDCVDKVPHRFELVMLAAHRARFAGTPVPAELERVRWLIEELRVSFFAQELGTAVSVSEKRVRQALARATRA